MSEADDPELVAQGHAALREAYQLVPDNLSVLIDWLVAANDTVSHAPDPPDNPLDWKELAAAYQAHHFSCFQFITAGLSQVCSRRCSLGLALWNNYSGLDITCDLQTEGIDHGKA